MFCPAKVFRDDPEFCRYLQHLWLSWKMGMSPEGGDLDTISQETAELLSAMIMAWESHSRNRDYRTLGKMLGGK